LRNTIASSRINFSSRPVRWTYFALYPPFYSTVPEGCHTKVFQVAAASRYGPGAPGRSRLPGNHARSDKGRNCQGKAEERQALREEREGLLGTIFHKAAVAAPEP